MACNMTNSIDRDVNDLSVTYFTYVIWFIIVPTVILNSLLLSLISYDKHLRSRRSNKFALSLFISHILNGFYGFIEAVSVIFTKKASLYTVSMDVTWRFYIQLSWNLIVCSIFINMLLIVVDRFMAIRYPFFYQNCKAKTLVFYTLLIGSTPYTIGWIVYFTKEKSLSMLTSAVTIPPVLCFVVYANSIVYIQTRKQFKDIVKLTVSNDHTENTKERQRLAKRQLRSLRVCLSLMLSFLATWLPMVGVMLFSYIVGTFSCVNENSFLFVYAWWNLNSVADPILYSSFNRDVKNKLKRILTLKRPVPQMSGRNWAKKSPAVGIA